MLILLVPISMIALAVLILHLQKKVVDTDPALAAYRSAIDPSGDPWRGPITVVLNDTVPEIMPESLKTPDPVRRFANAGSLLNYDKIGCVIDCRVVQNNGTDFMHLAVLVEDLTDGCEPMIWLVTNRYEAPLAQIGDRVRVAFRTDFKLEPVFRRTEVNAFFICWNHRIRRTGASPAAAI